MAFSFHIEKPNDINATFKKLKEKLEKHKGTLSGDDSRGYISSDGVEGSYIVGTDSIEITIHKKPLPIIPNRTVEKEIRRLFNKIKTD